MILSKGKLAGFIVAMGCSAPVAFGALTWPGCKDLADTDFKVTNIVTRAKDQINEPMKMAFDLLAAPGEDAKDKVDVYFTERYGLLRKFDSKQGKVVNLATFKFSMPLGNSSDGLMGIALDPAFKSNHQLFVYYSYAAAGKSSWRVSRFTLDNNNLVLNMASEVPVLDIPMNIGATHTGGAIQFDGYGDLWITTGNDFKNGEFAYSVWSSPNTNDLRGKILRIHPTPDGHYTIPSGNLFAASAKTKPEIYVMGMRNPYTMTMDPVRRWAAIGDVGPDDKDADGNAMNGANAATEKTEEQDLVVAPGNFGYPFFVGNNYVLKKGVNPSKPVIPADMDFAGVPKGLDTLPPAIPAIYPYPRSCAVTGPIYRYDGDLNSSIKFPPHFNRKWLFTDFNAGADNPITAATLSDDGKTITASEVVLKKVSPSLSKPLDFQQGPDGALYINNYAGYRTVTSGTGIIRIDYVGDCHPTTPKLETIPTTIHNLSGSADTQVGWMHVQGLSVRISSAGAFNLEVRDLLGRPVSLRSGYGAAHFDLNEIRKPGLYFVSVTAPEGQITRKLVRD